MVVLLGKHLGTVGFCGCRP
ncbi:TPA_asm: UL1 uORF [Human alphaherpesvirus 1]|nr:TPA_asm: UL1 uORF [Human alphaherpesvirus 1]